MLNYIRVWDYNAAQRVDKFIANSRTVQKRITKYYRRDSEVIYPPVETKQFFISENVGDYFLVGGRLAPYKRIDLVIEAFKITGQKLKIYGAGVDLARLKKLATGCRNIEFMGRVDDVEKAQLYAHCLAFINPQEEDFGITPVEAMASGRPAIAYAAGGATETIIAGVTGEFFRQQNTHSLVEVLRHFDATKYRSAAIREHAQKFNAEKFAENIKKFVMEEYQKFKN